MHKCNNTVKIEEEYLQPFPFCSIIIAADLHSEKLPLD